jgi:membrane fusion protein (multidrug efflux system)
MSNAAFPNHNRRNGFLILGALIVIAAIFYGLYWFLDARFYESTDDAYVAGNVVAITSRENATVMSLHADNTQTVKQGQLLIEMDPATADVNMAAAEANLARAVRNVRGEFSGADSFAPSWRRRRWRWPRRRAIISAANPPLLTAPCRVRSWRMPATRLRRRRRPSMPPRAGWTMPCRRSRAPSIAHNPDVLSAEAQLRNAAIALGHMRLVAPVDGVIAQRTVQVGQQVAAGTPLMAVVPLSNVWIDANFKEVQLADMRIGQKVTVTADIYGGSVTYHGHIEGLGAGSGSAFALLPPQNASGNWIKIVQRVPVRIALDPEELRRSSAARRAVGGGQRRCARHLRPDDVTSRMSGGTMTGDTGEDTDGAAVAR